MRKLCAPILLTVLLGASCAPQQGQTETGTEATQTAAPQATAQGFRFGVPVENESQALIAAEAGLGTGFRTANL